MASEELKSYDAVFIREENLSEASESQYADIYLKRIFKTIDELNQ